MFIGRHVRPGLAVAAGFASPGIAHQVAQGSCFGPLVSGLPGRWPSVLSRKLDDLAWLTLPQPAHTSSTTDAQAWDMLPYGPTIGQNLPQHTSRH